MKEGWVKVALERICIKAEKVKRKDMPANGELRYLDIGGIDNSTNRIVEHKDFEWKDAPSRAQQIVQVHDILFSTVRTYLKNIAQVTNPIYENEIASSGFTVIRGRKDTVDPKFLFYYSLSIQFLNPLSKLQTGSSYPAVRDKDVFAQPIPLPPLPEQRSIVAKLEQLFSEVDSGIGELQRAQAKLKVYRQAVLKKAFEGEYRLVELETVSEAVGGFAFKSSDFSKDERKYQVLRIGNIKTGELRLDASPIFVETADEKVLSRYLLRIGDIVITLTGTRKKQDYGFTAQIDRGHLLLNQRIAYLRFYDSVLPRFFLYY